MDLKLFMLPIDFRYKLKRRNIPSRPSSHVAELTGTYHAGKKRYKPSNGYLFPSIPEPTARDPLKKLRSTHSSSLWNSHLSLTYLAARRNRKRQITYTGKKQHRPGAFDICTRASPPMRVHNPLDKHARVASLFSRARNWPPPTCYPAYRGNANHIHLYGRQ